MLTEVSHVEDVEDLIRRVPAGYEWHYDAETGQLFVSSLVFADRSMQPSVDRRRLLQTLESAKAVESDGLLKLVAGEVRAITWARAGCAELHTTDVLHSPIDDGNADRLPPNPAHSHIAITPQMSKSQFDNKVRERLARLAAKNGWVVSPGVGNGQGA